MSPRSITPATPRLAWCTDGASSPPEDFLLLPAPLDLTFVGDTMYVADFAAGVVVVPPLPAAGG